MSKRSTAAWLLLGGAVVAVIFAVFFNSLHNGFVFDDLDIVVADPRIRDLHNLRGLITDAYRPLRSITYAVDYAVWGLNPFGFRLTNIAIHSANAVLVLFLGRKLTDGNILASAVPALLFAVHPVQVESVAYISGRRDVLFAFFYVLAFMAFMRFREATSIRARVGWIAATASAFALSLGSKEMAASFPILCGIWDVYRATAQDSSGERPSFRAVARQLVREGAWLYAAGIVTVGIFVWYTIYVRGATTRVLGTDIEFWGGTPLTNALTVPLTYAHYARLTIWPWPLAAQYYGAFDPASGFSDSRVIPALVFVVALAGISLYLVARTKYRLIGFGCGWFLVTLLPASQILPHHEIVADHYLYLPLVGVGLAVAGALVALEASVSARRIAPIAYGLVAIALVVFSVRTVARNRDFRSEATLWEATYAAVPGSPRAAYNYGLVLTNRGDHQEALQLYRQAIQADPTFVNAYFNLASTYAGLGRFDEARRVYRSALESDLDESARTWHVRSPDVLRAMYRTELAMLDAQTGDTASARDALGGILAVFPDLLRAEDFFATIVQMRGESAAMIQQYQAKVAAMPDGVADRIVLANLEWKAGRLDDAYANLVRVFELHPDSCFTNLYLAKYARDVKLGVAPNGMSVPDLFARAVAMALTPIDADVVRHARDGNAGALSG